MEEGDNRYTYSITHPATMIEEDLIHRFVSYEELPVMEYEPSEIEIIQERITILEGKLEGDTVNFYDKVKISIKELISLN